MNQHPPQTAKILDASPESLAKAALCLQLGEVVGMPTETVYGLAGNAFEPSALTKIFETKERPTFDPLIVHVAPEYSEDSDSGLPSLDQLSRLKLINHLRLSPLAKMRAEALMKSFWPGPLTLVLPKHPKVPDLVTGGLDTVGIRMPRHLAAQALIRAAGFPLAAPSANRFGRISPTSANDVLAELGDRISIIVDGGLCEIGLESTVLMIDPEGELTLLRPGGISEAQIEQVTQSSLSRAASPVAALKKSAELGPGMLDSHYAPSKKLYRLGSPVLELKELPSGINPGSLPDTLGILMLKGNAEKGRKHFESLTQRKVLAFTLSETGDLHESARNLFSTLRTLDESAAQVLFCEPCHETTGIGHAIADRLKRASHSTHDSSSVR